MAEAQETDKSEDLTFATMPGADALEQPENLDLNFETIEEETEETEDNESLVEPTEEEVEPAEEDAEEELTEEEELPQVAEAEEIEDIPPPKKKPMVPKARLDEVLAKQKALQKQLDDMKEAQAPAEDAPEEFDYDKGELEYQQLVLDGEAEKAAALRQQMRKSEREQIAYEMRKEMGNTVNQNAQETALATAAKELEEAFPVFDHNSEVFDQDLTQEVVGLRDAFITQGYEAVDALSKAVNFVVKSNDLEAESETPSLAATKNTQNVADKKRKEVSRKLKAAESQPPEMPGESSSARGEQAVNLGNLTEDEFNALPDATLKRLRGDLF
jgi:hypothetical protein